jgi:replicative DNA helicase
MVMGFMTPCYDSCPSPRPSPQGEEGFPGPPHSNEAEQGLLGAMMMDNRQVHEIADFLKPEHFFFPVHGRIFTAVLELNSKGQQAGPVLLKKYFEKEEELEQVGGAEYLVELAANVVSFINCPDYARTIFDLHRRREIINACNETLSEARVFDIDAQAETVLNEAEERLYRIGELGSASGGPVDMAGTLQDTFKYIESAQRGEIRGVRSGIHAIDKNNNGYMAGHLVIIAARPSMGKTALALTLAHNAACAKTPSLFFSMEMTKEELAQRLLARYTGISSGQQGREGGLSEQHGDWRELTAAQQKLNGLPLFIDESSGLNVQQVRSRALRQKRRHGLGFIIIDYLGLMNLPEKYNSKVDQLGEVTRGLKVMARDLEVPVILLHQLNRSLEGREDKRPLLSDLRDSGNIEQDADVVQFIYRDEYYLEREEPKRREKDTEEKFAERVESWQRRLDEAKGRADIITAKWRQGKIGTVRVNFNPVRQVFFDEEH